MRRLLPTRQSVLMVCACVAVATAMQLAIGHWFGPVFPWVPYTFAVFMAAWLGGLRPAVLALAVGYLVVTLAYVTPLDLGIRGTSHFAALFVFFSFGLFAGFITESLHRARERAEWHAARAREEGERLRVTLRSIGDAVLVADAEGRVASLNPVAEGLTGWTGEAARGRPLADVFRIIDETTLVAAEDPVRQVLRDGHALGLSNHLALLRPDGTHIAIADSAAPIRDGQGKIAGAILVFRDVSTQRRSERAVRESEDRLRTVLTKMPVCLIAFDMNGNLVVWNRECEHVTGYSEAEIVGDCGTLEHLHPDLEYRQRMFAEWRNPDEAYRNREWDIVARSGARRTLAWSNISSEFPIPGWSSWGIGFDVTERKSAEAHLRRLAVKAPVGIFQTDAEGNCLFVNDRWSALTGLSAIEAARRGWVAALHPDDRERVELEWYSAAQAGREFAAEYRFCTPEGETRWVVGRAVPLSDEQGQVAGYLGALEDITQARQAEEALRDAARKKDEFLAMLAHELRNPLAAIRYANHLSKVPELAGQVELDIPDLIEHEVTHLSRLIDDLLDASRIARGTITLKREPVDGRQVAQRAADALRSQFEQRRQVFHVSLGDVTLPLEADAIRLQQALENLLANAAKYTAEGGQVWFTACRDRGEVVFVVRDTGTGIPRDKLQEVFEPFVQLPQTLDRSEGGLGIGLTLVRSLVELHGGSVSARSEGVGSGSAFAIRLPAVEPRAAADSLAGWSEPGDEAGLRLLIVEDNVPAATMLRALLASRGHTVAVAHDGLRAVEIAPNFQPDIVLLDIGLPGLDGYQVAERLRRDDVTKDVNIIGISGYGQAQDRDRSRDAGFDHHLVKPVEFAKLVPLLQPR